ncbi:metalloproteinase inhibitor 4 [Hyperolius riggenbachi]|uniref:metalloproteinase inhibitor 4 n=1 Tax=Hyperolius riggenbachi TaxID=752182 RepID=UPI0035A35000
MNTLSYSLLLGTILLGTMKMSDACSCALSHPQQLFCIAEVVIRAKAINRTVHNSDSIDGEIQYGIEMMEMFKGWDKITAVHDVFTPEESSMCGVDLDYERKVEYLLTGYLYNNKVTIGLCGLHKPWYEVTSFQKKSLTDGTYKKGCEYCKIRMCSGEQCDNHYSDTCFWGDWDNGDQWLEDNSACVPGKDGSCSWQSSPDAKQPIHEGHP